MSKFKEKKKKLLKNFITIKNDLNIKYIYLFYLFLKNVYK
jgi:hypothetical protein